MSVLGKKRSRDKIGRNDPCKCGSGKKYKVCCLGEVEAARARALQAAAAEAPGEPEEHVHGPGCSHGH